MFAALVLAFQPVYALLRKVYEEHVTRSEREYGAEDPRTAQAARDRAFFLKEQGDNKAAVGLSRRHSASIKRSLGLPLRSRWPA